MPMSNWSKVKVILLLETFAAFGIHGGIGKKIYINEAGHMTKMFAIPIYGKEFKNRSLEIEI